MSDYISVSVAVIGAGFAGIAAVRQLRESGVDDVIVLEKATELGGAWRDNDYPGCACDIPSTLYSFSFAPNPGWTSSFASQREILAYLRDCARRFGVTERIRFGAEVVSANWDAAARRWLLDTTGGRFGAEVLIVATGPFARPSVPDIPGLAEFAGETFHSARWNHDHDLTGRRVAVVGTGASAIQIVPAVAGKARAVHVYQRTPPWVLPKRVRPTPAAVRSLYRRVPAAQRAVRAVQYWSRELPGYAMTRPRLLAMIQRQALAHLRAQVPDALLRARLTPGYTIFCKRVLVSSDYYPTLTRPHVELVDDPIARVERDSIITADGARRPVDTIVLATGFTVTRHPIAERLYGVDGRSLARTWQQDGRAAYLGTCVAGFPNMFLCPGPNSGTGYTSLLVMIEAQLAYIVDCVRTMARRGLDVVEVSAEAQRAFTDEVATAMAGTVWITGGCASYYLDSAGRNSTVWPGSSRRFRRRTRRFDLAPYRVERRVTAAAGPPAPAGSTSDSRKGS